MRSVTQSHAPTQVITLSPSQGSFVKPKPFVLPQNEVPLVQIKVEKLVEKMKNSGLFSHGQLASIDAWKQETSPYFSQKILKKTKLPIALASLLLDTIRPTLCEGKDECLDFEDTLKELLQPLLPPGQSVDAFLEEQEAEDLERTVMEEKFRQIDLLHQEEMRMVCDAGNRETLKILQTHGKLKQALSGVSAERKKMVHEVHGEFDRLTQETEDLSKELTQRAVEAEDLGEQMREENAALRRLLIEGRNLKV